MRIEQKDAGGEAGRARGIGIALALMALVLAACSRQSGFGPGWTPAPAPAENSSLVYLYRQDVRANPSTVHVELDGQPIGTLGDLEYTPLRMAPGLHVLRARLSTGLILSTSWNRVQFAAKGGETVFLHVFVEFDSTGVDPTLDADFGAPGRGSQNVAAKVFLALPTNVDGQRHVERCTLAQDIHDVRDAYGGRERP